ncbi:carboxypeptidase M-like [Notamacropus eugenii]|uniref:carboxypeptidase M-like n=1 Tax=Notamacropus eugenii TaxID=9315 RepID=UPI003B6770ED
MCGQGSGGGGTLAHAHVPYSVTDGGEGRGGGGRQLFCLHMRSSTSYEGAAPVATHAQLHQLRGLSSSGYTCAAPPATRAQLLWLHMRSSSGYTCAAPPATRAQLLSTSYEGAAPLPTHAQLHQLRGRSSCGYTCAAPPATRAQLLWLHMRSSTSYEETGTKRGFSLTPDNDVFEYLAYTYSSKNPEMKTGNFCENSINFPDGITNGYLWYPLKGGMQDYNYIWAQCFEITLEVSCCKYPPEENLPDFWNKKRDSLISFMKQVHLGIKGQVFDVNKNPIPNVIVEAKGRNHICPFRTNKFGEYYLLLLPGSYTINATVPGHKTILKQVTIPENTQNFSALRVDFHFPFQVKSDYNVITRVSCSEVPLYMYLRRHSDRLMSHFIPLFLLTFVSILHVK